MAKKKKEQKNQEPEELSPEELDDASGVVDMEGDLDANDSEVAAELTAEEQLQQQLEASREDARKNQDLYLRTLADMENLRKRSQREKEDLAKFGNEMILREILPVRDNLERAVEHAVLDESATGLLEGVKMTLDQFGKVLEKFHVVSVEAVGQVFDPALHQAMGQIETEEHPPNTVAQEMQKGYLLNDRLLRPSLVMVAKAPAVQEENVDAAKKDDAE
ncbi:MAG TPA: nucleotide exchange factor GrpE [Geopsychrobacteraceae bacterium]|nr:nucleotide exchange factor GrpE [Geopsychrobacteraceae bacterium]